MMPIQTGIVAGQFRNFVYSIVTASRPISGGGSRGRVAG
jgi:hypothetical protein